MGDWRGGKCASSLDERRTPDQFQRTEIGEPLRRLFDGASHGLKIASVIVDQRHSRHQRSRSDHFIESPTSQALLARFNRVMGSSRGCWRIGQQSHDLARNHGDCTIQRPNRTDRVEIGDSGSFDMLSPLLGRGSPQQTVTPSSLQNCDRGNLNLVVGEVGAHPGKEFGIPGSCQPTLRASVEKEGTGRRIDHRLAPLYRLRNDAVENRRLFLREASERLPIRV